MAVTLALFAAVQLLMPGMVRPHLIPPARATAAVQVSLSNVQMNSNGQVTVPVTNQPGAWIITNQTITPAGRVFVLPVVAACQSGSEQQCDAWYARQHLRRRITYLPASRYWALQWYETAIFLALAIGLAGLSAGQVRYRRLA
jgi:hypothetical protein